MSTPDIPPTEVTSPSVEEETHGFDLVVDQLARFQNERRVLLFLTSRFTVRLIGETERYREAAITALESIGIKGGPTADIINEVQTVLQACLYAGNRSETVKLLDRPYFAPPNDEEEPSPEQRSHKAGVIKRKIDLVWGKLIQETLRERANRLKSGAGAVLHDLDMEVISERRGHSVDAEVHMPFLRLRLRYVESASNSFNYYLPPFMLPDSLQTKSFEVECDESDINLLILRLESARDLLVKALGASNQPSSNSPTHD